MSDEQHHHQHSHDMHVIIPRSDRSDLSSIDDYGDADEQHGGIASPATFDAGSSVVNSPRDEGQLRDSDLTPLPGSHHTYEYGDARTPSPGDEYGDGSPVKYDKKPGLCISLHDLSHQLDEVARDAVSSSCWRNVFACTLPKQRKNILHNITGVIKAGQCHAMLVRLPMIACCAADLIQLVRFNIAVTVFVSLCILTIFLHLSLPAAYIKLVYILY
jgi:hypothetical protein